jgi:hypothetical protein
MLQFMEDRAREKYVPENGGQKIDLFNQQQVVYGEVSATTIMYVVQTQLRPSPVLQHRKRGPRRHAP